MEEVDLHTLIKYLNQFKGKERTQEIEFSCDVCYDNVIIRISQNYKNIEFAMSVFTMNKDKYLSFMEERKKNADTLSYSMIAPKRIFLKYRNAGHFIKEQHVVYMHRIEMLKKFLDNNDEI